MLRHFALGFSGAAGRTAEGTRACHGIMLAA
jgi:hypothetical protein